MAPVAVERVGPAEARAFFPTIYCVDVCVCVSCVCVCVCVCLFFCVGSFVRSGAGPAPAWSPFRPCPADFKSHLMWEESQLARRFVHHSGGLMCPNIARLCVRENVRNGVCVCACVSSPSTLVEFFVVFLLVCVCAPSIRFLTQAKLGFITLFRRMPVPRPRFEGRTCQLFPNAMSDTDGKKAPVPREAGGFRLWRPWFCHYTLADQHSTCDIICILYNCIYNQRLIFRGILI